MIAPSPQKTTILLIEDQSAIRQMMAAYIGTMPKYAIIADCGDCPEAVSLTERHQPDIVILDWILGAATGLDYLLALKRLHRRPKVLVFSGVEGQHHVQEALRAGVNGYLEKTAAFTEFTLALDRVAAGGAYLGARISSVVKNILKGGTKVGTPLSPREREVLRLVARGLTTAQIGRHFGISPRTVSSHRAAINRKTGLRTMASLVAYAMSAGLLETDALSAPSFSASGSP